MFQPNEFKSTNIIVVRSGHRLYKEDGTDNFLEVTQGNSVFSGRNIYMVEEDYQKLATKLGESN